MVKAFNKYNKYPKLYEGRYNNMLMLFYNAKVISETKIHLE